MAAFRIESKPLRTVLRWQLLATVVCAIVAAVFTGTHGGISALLGGSVSWAAGLVFALMASVRRVRTAGETLRILLRAEASKIMLMVILLWLVLTVYREIVPVAFFAVFIVSVLVSQSALLVRET